MTNVIALLVDRKRGFKRESSSKPKSPSNCTLCSYLFIHISKFPDLLFCAVALTMLLYIQTINVLRKSFRVMFFQFFFFYVHISFYNIFYFLFHIFIWFHRYTLEIYELFYCLEYSKLFCFSCIWGF